MVHRFGYGPTCGHGFTGRTFWPFVVVDWNSEKSQRKQFTQINLLRNSQHPDHCYAFGQSVISRPHTGICFLFFSSSSRGLFSFLKKLATPAFHCSHRVPQVFLFLFTYRAHRKPSTMRKFPKIEKI